MIVELPPECFTKIRHLLGEVSHYIVLTTLLEGRTPGKIWVDQLKKPAIALVWDRLNTFFYLAGDSTDSQLNRELNSLIHDKIFPEATRLGYRKFFLQVTPKTWADQMGVLLSGVSASQRSIYGYTLAPNHADSLGGRYPEPPAGYTMVRLTSELLNNTHLKNLADVVYCITACWRSTEQYLCQGGVGYCLIKNDAIAAWCSTDYVTGEECELYVTTFEGYRRQGLGTLVARACLQDCLAKGLTVHWHCFGDNTGSVRIAEKTGFTQIVESPVYVVDLP